MTKREAIRECKRLWKEIVESGLPKIEFLETKAGQKWRYKDYYSDCPLCEYVYGKIGLWCDEICPLRSQYKTDCFGAGYTKYKNAARFYEYVKGLKE